jgi:hypothetical protein
MMKITFAVAIAAAVLMPAPLLVGAIPAEAQNLKMAQGVDVQIGRDRDDRDRRRRNDSDVTVGVGPGGVTIGPRQNCRMVTTTVERDDGAQSRARSAVATKRHGRTEMARKPGPFCLRRQGTVLTTASKGAIVVVLRPHHRSAAATQTRATFALRSPLRSLAG